jgi:hypothetical protein
LALAHPYHAVTEQLTQRLGIHRQELWISSTLGGQTHNDNGRCDLCLCHRIRKKIRSKSAGTGTSARAGRTKLIICNR